ncbi:7700_t:CDS:10, partial [Gigaspora margarita]
MLLLQNSLLDAHNEFVDKIKNYTRNCGFTIRLGKSEYYKKSENKESKKTIQKRTLLYSRAKEFGLEKRELDAEEFVKILDQFKYNDTEFFYYVDINEDTKRLEQAIWMFPEQCINYSRFNNIVVYDNTYKTNRFKMPFGIFTRIFIKFLEMLNQYAPAVILTNNDRAMSNAYSKVLQPLGTKYQLCQWHLMKNVMKNLSAKLNTNWSAFIRDLYKCLREMDAACFNSDTFIVDITTTQYGESMNNMMKDPSKEEIINNYIVFLTSTSTSPQLTLSMQRFATQNPTIAATLYNSFNKIFISEVETINKLQSSNSKITPTIKNPLIIQGRGHPSNKRITSTIELTSNKKKNCENKENTDRLRLQDSINLDNYQSNHITYNTEPLDEIQDSNTIITSSQFQDPDFLVHHLIETNFLSDKLNLERDQNEDTQCLYCDEALPSPLPLKVSKYLNDIATKKKSAHTAVEQYEFCQVHRGEGIIIPYGPGYYGTKDLAIILKTLTKIFFQPKILTTNLCALQSLSQYLAQVLTPETAIRLIAEDFNNISLDMAKKIMIDSIEFGL